MKNITLSMLLIFLTVAPLMAIAFTPVNADTTPPPTTTPTLKQVAKATATPFQIKKVARTTLNLNAQVTAATQPSDQTNQQMGTKWRNTNTAQTFASKQLVKPQIVPLIPNVFVEDAIVNQAPSSSLKVAKGLNAIDNGLTNGFDLEPPDQGLCVGNGYVLEPVNVVLRVYTTSNFGSFSSDLSLNSLMGLSPDVFTSDPKCLYDTDTGHWFLTILAFFEVDQNPGTALNSFVYIAVSQTSVPWGFWNIYAVNATDGPGFMGGPGNPGCPCLPDQPLIGANKDAFVISTNEYAFAPIANSVTPTDLGFNGAQLYMIDKQGLALGYSIVNLAYLNTGLIPTPENSGINTCYTDTADFFGSTGDLCWASVQPATSPSVSSYDTTHGGTEYAMSSFDFNGLGDNLLAVWAFLNTTTLHFYTPSSALVDITTIIFTFFGVNAYYMPCGPALPICIGYLFGFGSIFNPFFAPQKPGPIPLGDTRYGFFAHGSVCSAACPEGPIQPNDDRMNQVVYAQHKLWGGVNTILSQHFSSGSPEYHAGIAYWIVGAFNVPSSLPTLVDQGYIAPKHQEAMFPSIATGPSGGTDNNLGTAVFTLTGNGYFPSTAYARVTTSSHGTLAHTLYIVDAGQSPQDGFTEYQNFADGVSRPRWGDYTAAVWVGGRIYFATEYIQSPNCSDSVFTVDPSCGGTRDKFANWGTSLNWVTG